MLTTVSSRLYRDQRAILLYYNVDNSLIQAIQRPAGHSPVLQCLQQSHPGYTETSGPFSCTTMFTTISSRLYRDQRAILLYYNVDNSLIQAIQRPAGHSPVLQCLQQSHPGYTETSGPFSCTTMLHNSSRQLLKFARIAYYCHDSLSKAKLQGQWKSSDT